MHMQHHVRLAAAALTAALALALATGTAAGLRSLSLSPAGEFRMAGRAITYEGEGIRYQYNVTFSGTLARAIAKTRGSHAGSITRGTVEGCRVIEPPLSTCTGRAGPLVEEPAWNINFESFLGTLPSITGVLLVVERATLLIAEAVMSVPRLECLYRGNLVLLARVGARGEFNRLAISERSTLTLAIDLNNSMVCPLIKAGRGEFSLEPTQTVRLI